jgi:hypothetical protein
MRRGVLSLVQKTERKGAVWIIHNATISERARMCLIIDTRRLGDEEVR